ncbi:Heterokaryon incompatibility protein (HET) domain containing protein [Hyaloscypha variabilis]
MNLKSGYRYSPLESGDSIRLLQVEKVPSTAKGRGPIRCWIRHFPLAQAPPYRALSYAWGADSTKKLFLNDKIIQVRRNLWEALAHIQFSWYDPRNAEKDDVFVEENSRWVWIDALSIDQTNVEERSTQVGLMGRIYGKATKVLVWLGCEDDFHHGARISEAVEALSLMNDDKSGQDPSQVLDRNLEGLLALFQLPYWQRLWIIQEICLAKKITLLFDKVSTSWRNVTHFRKLLGSAYFPNKFSLPPGSTFTVAHKTDLLRCQAFRLDRHRTSSHGNVLGYLIESFHSCLCTDPRDKVYALIGLAEDCQSGDIQPNYFKTLFQVYADVISFYSSSRRSKGPSQHTPRFSQILQRAFQSDLSEGAIEYQLRLHPSLRQPTLHIFGVSCGIITKFIRGIDLSSSSCTSPAWWKDTAPADLPATSASFSRHLASLPEQRKLVPMRSRISFAVQAKYASSTLISEHIRTSSSSGDILQEDRNQTLQFVLDNGRVGYAPYNSLPGDMIVQFLGCDVAAVLRPTGGGRRKSPIFDIVGKALVGKERKEEKEAEPWAKKYGFAVPDYGENFNWTEDQAMWFYLDVVTLQYLTQ